MIEENSAIAELSVPTADESAAEGAIAEIAKIKWERASPGEDCPETMIPALEDLVEWWPDCPPDDREEADKRWAVLAGLPPDEPEGEPLNPAKPLARWDISPIGGGKQLCARKLIWVTHRSQPDGRPFLVFYPWTIDQVHKEWLNRRKSVELLHPLVPIIAAWQNRPIKGRVNLRDNRILPSRVAMVEPHDRRAGRLFTPALHAIGEGDRQQVFPGFGVERERITPALPLALYDLGGGSSMERGRGAPLALRLFVESILAVGLEDRDRNRPVAIEITLRDLLLRLYPGRRPKPNEYWPKLNKAVEILDATRIPWEDPATGKGGARRVVSVADIPRGPGKLDDILRIIVDLPPGSGVGPVVSPNLPLWGVKSAPAYRGLLNLAYHWFEPGKTRFPVRGGKYWLQTGDPRRYEKVTGGLLAELFYPTSTQKQRRNLASRARKILGQLVDAGEARVIEGRLLPPDLD